MDDKLYSKIINNPLWFVFFLILTLYICNFFYPDSTVNSISEGDIGRDLYNYYLVSKGYLPYIDFNYIYGPLMPLFYGFAFKIFGVSYLTAMSFWFLFNIVAFIAMFYLVKYFSNYLTAFIAGLFFVAYHGFSIQTFNHIGGIIFIIFAILLLKLYLDTEKPLYVYLIAIACFLLAITKLNMGLAFSGPIFFFLIFFNIINKKPVKHLIYSCLLFLGLTAIVYGFLLSFSPLDQIGKSFPYSRSSLQAPFAGPVNTILGADSSIVSIDSENNPVLANIFWLLSLNLWAFILIIFSIIIEIFVYKNEKFGTNFIFIAILCLTALLSTHEFISIGTFYSLRFWTLSIEVPLIFFIINYLIETYNNKKLFKLVFPIFLISLIFITGIKFGVQLLFHNIEKVHCSMDRAKVNFTNIPWYLTTYKVIDYINNNTNSNDKILALPYNMLYLFLSKRESPNTRYNEFLYLTHLTEQDEINVIKSMEEEKVNVVVYVNRIGTREGGGGYFGSSHCILIDNYIKENYDLEVSFFFKEYKLLLLPVSVYKRVTPFIKSENKENLTEIIRKKYQLKTSKPDK